MKITIITILSLGLFGCDVERNTCGQPLVSENISVYYEPMSYIDVGDGNEMSLADYPLFNSPLITNLEEHKRKTAIVDNLEIGDQFLTSRNIVEQGEFNRAIVAIIISNIEGSVLIIDSAGVACVYDKFCYQIPNEKLVAVDEYLHSLYRAREI